MKTLFEEKLAKSSIFFYPAFMVEFLEIVEEVEKELSLLSPFTVEDYANKISPLERLIETIEKEKKYLSKEAILKMEKDIALIKKSFNLENVKPKINQNEPI